MLEHAVAEAVAGGVDHGGAGRQRGRRPALAVVLVALLDRPGGIFVRRSEQMSEDDKVLIQTVARLIVSDAGGTIAEATYTDSGPEPLLAKVFTSDNLDRYVKGLR